MCVPTYFNRFKLPNGGVRSSMADHINGPNRSPRWILILPFIGQTPVQPTSVEPVELRGRREALLTINANPPTPLHLQKESSYRQPCINTVPLNFLTVRRSCPANHFYNHHKTIWRRLEGSLRPFVAKKVILPENSETLYKKLSDLVVESMYVLRKYLEPSVLDIFSWFIPCLWHQFTKLFSPIHEYQSKVSRIIYQLKIFPLFIMAWIILSSM